MTAFTRDRASPVCAFARGTLPTAATGRRRQHQPKPCPVRPARPTVSCRAAHAAPFDHGKHRTSTAATGGRRQPQALRTSIAKSERQDRKRWPHLPPTVEDWRRPHPLLRRSHVVPWHRADCRSAYRSTRRRTINAHGNEEKRPAPTGRTPALQAICVLQGILGDPLAVSSPRTDGAIVKPTVSVRKMGSTACKSHGHVHGAVWRIHAVGNFARFEMATYDT